MRQIPPKGMKPISPIGYSTIASVTRDFRIPAAWTLVEYIAAARLAEENQIIRWMEVVGR